MNKPKIILEMKKENSDESTFYRYRFRNTKFWFDVMKDGAIYCVYIASYYKDDVEYYLDCEYGEKSVCRPTKTRFRFKNSFLSANEADDFIKKAKEAKLIAETIDAFFENGKFD